MMESVLMGENNLLETFESDDYLRRFLPDILQASSDALQSTLSVADQLSKLSDGIVMADAEIQRLVMDKHQDLLSQATWIDKLEGVLEMMALHLQMLLSGTERVRSRITEPYLNMEKNLHILRNVLDTLDALRHISCIQTVTKRLTAHMTSHADDLVKLSEDIKELGELWTERDVAAIEILEEDRQCLKTAKRDVGNRAKKLLLVGVQSHNAENIAQAVQVLHNINTLQRVVMEVAQSAQNSLEQMVKDSLDPSSFAESVDAKKPSGKTNAPVAFLSPNFRPKLWSTLEKLFENILQQCLQIEQLELALRKPKSDFFTSTNDIYLDEFPEKTREVAKSFWLNVTNALAGYLNKYASESVLLRQALEGEYPKFLRFYIDLCKKLSNADRPERAKCPFEMNKKVISAFEKSYLSKSVNMVLDPVHNMFSKDGGAPSAEEVDVLIGKIRSELSVALFDPNLSSTIARNITKAVRLFCSKCDSLVDKSPEATQVIGPRKRVQDENIAVANITEYLKGKLQSVMANLNTDTDATMIVSLSLVDADNLITAILNPILTALEKAIHDILLTIHREDFSKDSGAKVSTSLYMRELQEFISRAYLSYLKPFHSEEVVHKCACATGQRCVQLFIRHASIIRPLGAHGRAKLINDCNQLETAVAPLLGGEPKTYRSLRSFRSLLSQTPEEILGNSVVGETVPVSVALFYLFSHAPDEMKSPHQSGVNWTVEELSGWLDAHPSERDRLGLVSGALGRYCNLIRQQPGRDFHPVYGVMAQLIQKTGDK